MKQRLIQLFIDDLNEELWYFPVSVTFMEIKEYYNNYQSSKSDSFEDYMEEMHPEIDAEKTFVNEVYI